MAVSRLGRTFRISTTSVSPGFAPSMAIGPTSPGHLPPSRSYQSPQRLSLSSTSPGLTVRIGGRTANVACPAVGLSLWVSASAAAETRISTRAAFFIGSPFSNASRHRRRLDDRQLPRPGVELGLDPDRDDRLLFRVPEEDPGEHGLPERAEELLEDVGEREADLEARARRRAVRARPEDDARRRLKFAGEPELDEHPVDPVGRLAGVLEQEDPARRFDLVWCPHGVRDQGQVPADQPAA